MKHRNNSSNLDFSEKPVKSLFIDDVPNALLELESRLQEIEQGCINPADTAREGLGLLRPAILAIAAAVEQLTALESEEAA